MAKPVEGAIRAVWGPTPRGVKSQVTVQTVDGVKHNRTFSVLADAEAFASDCRGRISQPGCESVEVPEYTGDRQWWDRLLAARVRAMLVETNPLLRESIRKEVDTIAKACQAAPKLVDQARIDQRLTALEQQEASVARARKHGPRASRQARPTREAPRPGTPIR